MLDQIPGRIDVQRLLAALVDDGHVSAEKARLVGSVAVSRAGRQPNALVAVAGRDWSSHKEPGRKLDLAFLTEWLAHEAQLNLYRIDPLKIDVAAVTGCVSYAYAERYTILPIKVSATEVVFATAEPFERDWEHELAPILQKQISRVIANPVDIQRYLLEFYALSRSIKSAGSRFDGSTQARSVQNLEQLTELGQSGKLDADDSHIVNIVDWLFQYAFEQRASDIHMEPGRDEGIVRFRIDGVLHQVYDIPPAIMTAVTSRIKILGRMDVAEKRRPQDGRIKTRNPNGDEIELRLSTMPVVFGEKLVMRIFNPEVLMKRSEELGFTKSESQIWHQLLHQPYGIVLVTGPTGSGKTTTLYSSMRELASSENNLCTIEDPIELVVPGINQMQVQSAIDVTFAAGVRTLMRQDPDIIMIGEIRDRETAEMAAQAALTGHLVLSTLHTNDAPSTVARLTELGLPPYLIKATLLGVVAQRLIRTLCPHCKQEAELSPQAWREMIAPFKTKPPAKVFEPVGCLECRNTGYLGRIGVYELLQVSQTIKNMISHDIDLAALRGQAIKDGMLPLRLAGAQKVAHGVTTIEEVLRVTPSAVNE